MDSSTSGRGCNGNTFQIASKASSQDPICIASLPLFSLADEIKKVRDLLCLDILPCCFENGLFQAGTALLDRSTAGITNEDHDVPQDATGPLLNKCGWSWFSFDRTLGKMGVLTEWKEQLNRRE